MTAFALDFRRDRIRIACDTAIYIPGAESAVAVGFTDKMIPITRLNAVVFARGQLLLCVQAAAQLMLAIELKTLEAAAAALPALLRGLAAQYGKDQNIDDIESRNVLEFTLAGWSESEQQMKLWQFMSVRGFAPYENQESDYGFLTVPFLPREYTPDGADITIEQRLVLAMMGERDFFARNAHLVGGAMIGGEVRLFDIQRGG